MPHDSVGEFLETLRHCHPEIWEGQYASTFEKSNFIALCDRNVHELRASIERHSNGSAAQQPEDDQGAAEIEAETDDQGVAEIEAERIDVSGDPEHFQRNMLIVHVTRLGRSLYWVSDKDKDEANAPMTSMLNSSENINLLNHFYEQLICTRSAFSNQSIDSSLKVKVLLEHMRYAVYLMNSNNPLHCRFSSKFIAYLFQLNITQNLWHEYTSEVDWMPILNQVLRLLQSHESILAYANLSPPPTAQDSELSLLDSKILERFPECFQYEDDDDFSQDEDDELVGIYEAHQDNITFQRIILKFGLRIKALVYALMGHVIKDSMEMSELNSCLIQLSQWYDSWITRDANLQLISNYPSLRVERPLTLYCPVIYKALINIARDLPGFDYEILLNLAWTSRSFRQSVLSEEKNPFLIVQNMIDNHKDRFLNQLIATDSIDAWTAIMSDQGQAYLRDRLFQKMQLYSFVRPGEVRFDQLSPLEHQIFQRYINLIDSCLPTFYVYQMINLSSATRVFQPLQAQWICKLNQFWMNPNVYLDDEIKAYLKTFESRLRDDHQQGIIEDFKSSLLTTLNGDPSESKTSDLLGRCVEFCEALDLGKDSIQTSILFIHQYADQCSLGSPAGDAPSSPIAYSSLDSDQLRAVSIPVPVPIAVHASTHDATSSLNAKPY